MLPSGLHTPHPRLLIISKLLNLGSFIVSLLAVANIDLGISASCGRSSRSYLASRGGKGVVNGGGSTSRRLGLLLLLLVGGRLGRNVSIYAVDFLYKECSLPHAMPTAVGNCP